LVEVTHLADAYQASSLDRYKQLSTLGSQDSLASPDLVELAQREIDRLLALGTRESAWSAFRLLILAAADPDLGLQAHAIYSSIAYQLRDSSLWMLKVSPKVQSRESIARVLFAASETPEVLDRPPPFEGIPAARGLGATQDGMGSYLAPAFTVAAPWLLGFGFPRLLGHLILMFGHPEGGRAGGVSGDLIELLAPKLLAEPVRDVLSQPDCDPEEIRRWIKWWLHRLDLLLSVVSDPSSFVSADGVYDYTRHFAFQLSLDRLFACVSGILIESRRDEFTRRLLMFQALDLLHGMGFGDYVNLLNPEAARSVLGHLEQTLPYEVAKLALPKCRAAVEALGGVTEGFYLTERIADGKLRLARRDGGTEWVGLARATAEYLNLVRAGQHSFEEKVRNPRDVSLLASHSGELDARLSDIAFLHLLNAMADDDLVRSTIHRVGLRPVRRGR